MSIKKVSLIAVAATVAVMAMATSALANNGAALTTTKADPVTNITAGKPQSGGLFLDVTNCQPTDSGCISSGGSAPTQVSEGVYGQDISWSKEVTIGKSKQPVCNSATISALTYKNALAACNGSQMGVGVAVIPAVIVTPTKTNKTAGYSKTLHVFGSGPHVSPPSQSITDFWANVNYGVKTKCGLAGQTGNVNIKYQGEWDTDATPQGGTPDKTDNTTQNCSYVP
jgi:hypothetical protein